MREDDLANETPELCAGLLAAGEGQMWERVLRYYGAWSHFTLLTEFKRYSGP